MAQHLPESELAIKPLRKLSRFWKNPPTGGFFPSVAGFTLVELVITMVIVGIMAIVALPKWSGNSGFDERGFRDRVVAGLRYAQKSAVAARRTVCATFANTPAQVTFRISATQGAADCNTGNDLIGPDGRVLVIAAPAYTTFSSFPAAVLFGSVGQPLVAGTQIISVAGLPVELDIHVETDTGYVF